MHVPVYFSSSRGFRRSSASSVYIVHGAHGLYSVTICCKVNHLIVPWPRFTISEGLRLHDNRSARPVLMYPQALHCLEACPAWPHLQPYHPSVQGGDGPGPLPPLPRLVMAVKTLRDKSFQVEAPKLFNALPAHLRKLNTTADTFKAHLDSYLETIPDQPAIPGLVPAASNLSGRPSNSIRDWARQLQSSN
jgi:hypothetical protein